MSDKATVASVSLLAITSSVSMFATFLPEFSDIRKASGDPDVINDVRMGEVAAIGLTLAIGISASALSDSPIPAGVAIVAALALAVMYETVLATPPKERVTA